MSRAFACLLLLWFFYRFDLASSQIVIDGGHEEQMTCEAQAAQHGYLALLISSRPEVRAGKTIGFWQRACFEGTEGVRGAVTVNVR